LSGSTLIAAIQFAAKLGNVFVKQLDCAYADGDEEQALCELEQGDNPETLAVVSVT
jgi:hypothetical protein